MAEEQELQKRSTRSRLFELDALRGLAAVTVVTHHFRYAFDFTPTPWYWLPFDAGRQAVVLFFVLSGYVLSMPYWRGRQAHYVEYLLRRFCRIYLPFAAAATLSIAGAWLFRGRHLPLSEWFNNTWQQPITGRLLIEQYLMFPVVVFNVAFWSLGFEMQMSIVMPLLSNLLRRWNAPLVSALMALIAFGIPGRLHLHEGYLLRSLQIATLFALGATLAGYQERLTNWLEGKQAMSWVLLLTGVLLYYNVPDHFAYGRLLGKIVASSDFISGIGAAAVIVSSLTLRPLSRFLRHSSLEYLGRISYSLYLVHSITLFSVLDILFGKISRPALAIIFALTTLIAAHLFCITIEEPSIRLGKRLQGRWPKPA
ncbi:acyltransferase [Granulicella sp. S156]|uniref:acyltransferase family protein n=1 Tax=Granulicella sp. S156 TaxID=1747224 RepID=UPI00131BF09F|nr:acyltransferase [Granulicella sp. S156]